MSTWTLGVLAKSLFSLFSWSSFFITLNLFLSWSFNMRLWVHSQLWDKLTLIYDRCRPLHLVVLLNYVTRSLVFEVPLAFEVLLDNRFSISINCLKLCSWVCFEVFYLHLIFLCKQVSSFARCFYFYFFWKICYWKFHYLLSSSTFANCNRR